MTQINLTPVLKGVNDLADDPATAISCDGCIEMNRAMGTVGACKRVRDCAFKWLGALLAKRCDNADGFCVALIAKIFTGSDICAADVANRRIEKRCDCTYSIKLWERDHISTRLALLPTSRRSRQAAQYPRADFFPATGEQESLDVPRD